MEAQLTLDEAGEKGSGLDFTWGAQNTFTKAGTLTPSQSPALGPFISNDPILVLQT